MRQHLLNTKRIPLLAVAGLMLLGLCGCGEVPEDSSPQATYTIDKPYYKGPLRVRIRCEKDAMSLSGLLLFEITTELDSEYDLHRPVLNERLKQFRVRRSEEQPEKLIGNNKLLTVQTYQLEPLNIGSCEIPELTFTVYKDGVQDVEKSDLTTDSIWIDVTSSLSTDMQDVTLEAIEDVVEMEARPRWIWFVGGGVVAVLVCVFIALHKKQAVVEVKRVYKPAHQIALERLKALAEEHLVEQGRIKLFYEKLSGCLRQYIENRFELHAPEQTTEEFLNQLKTSNALKLEYKQDLQGFLEHCDLVKFARYEPSNAQINESLHMAEQFVETTQSAQCLVEVTGCGQPERQVV